MLQKYQVCEKCGRELKRTLDNFRIYYINKVRHYHPICKKCEYDNIEDLAEEQIPKKKKDLSNKTFCVYIHTSPSEKTYIGITCQDVQNRWKNGRRYLEKNKNGKYAHPAFANAINKYSWKVFKHEVRFKNLTEKDAKMIEVDLIYYFKKIGKSYNISDGGDGFLGKVLTEEHKQILREANLGKKHKEESKILMSLHMKGREPWNKGKTWSDEHIKKVSRHVLQYDLDGNFIREWDTAKEAMGQMNAPKVREVCSGARKSSGGYIWKWKE